MQAGGLTEQSASQRAAASGEPVEVTAARTEYTTTLANPDGTFTLTQATQPQRARAKDGSWRDVDITLEKRADGRIAPKAAVVDLSFSAGGSGAGMLSLSRGDRQLKLGWPGALPEPTLDGAAATYANVPVKGVDLQLTATAEGYREVLVVKSAEAAASSELEKIRLTAAGEGLSVVPGEGGGLRAVDADGNAVFRGPAGQMWDSAVPTPAPQSRTTSNVKALPEQTDDPAQPDEGNVTAELPVAVGDGAVSVQPDLDLLRGKDTVYPVFIDPSVGLGLSEWTKLSSDGDKFYKFTEPKGVGYCGYADGYACPRDGNGAYKDRMYFEFGPGALSGKYVLDATFRAYETWSWNCDPHWVDLERTDNFGEGTRWPGPKMLDQMGDRYVSAGRADLCSPSQPNSWIEFNDNPDEADENLVSTVRAFAAGKFDRLTLMLKAKDEGDPRAWKRFDNNAELKVNYVHKPGVPTSVGAINGTGNEAGPCQKSPTSPQTVTVLTPTVQARVQTLVEQHQGEEEGSLQAEFYMERSSDDTSKGTWSQVWSDYKPEAGWDPDGTLETAITTKRAEGGLYRFRARTQSHWVYGGKSGDLFSPYSSWCYLRVDTKSTLEPTITTGGPYTTCVTNDCAPNGTPGTPGIFTFKPNAADKDVKAYQWRLLTSDAKATKTVKPTVTNGPWTESAVIPALSGTQTLEVKSSDLVLDKEGRVRWGPAALFTFKVGLDQGPTGRWRFDDGKPGNAVTVAKDTGEVGTRHDVTIHDEAATGWSTLGRRGAGDYSLRLNDNLTDAAKQVGHATTSAPAVNTGDSFTVSAWAYLTDDTKNHVVLAQPGKDANAFTLYYSAAYKKWVFNRTDRDLKSPVYIRSMADAENPPLRVWTHLAAVYKTEGEDGQPDTDPANDTIQLFVNGRPQGEPVLLAKAAATYEPWTATAGLQFGRSVKDGTGSEYFLGRLDEVAVWQEAHKTEQIRLESRLEKDGVPANELVAHWDAANATGTSMPESKEDPDDPNSKSFPYQRGGMTLSASGAALNGDDNTTALVLNGTSGTATTTGPVVDETGSFTVSAQVRLKKTLLAAKPVGYRGLVASQATPAGKESSWALWVEKVDTDVYQWKFGRTAVDASGKVVDTALAPAEDKVGPKEFDTWVNVTGVFDATKDFTAEDGSQEFGVAQLYVGPAPQQGSEDGKDPFLVGVQQGAGILAAGSGSVGGKTGNYLAGDLAKVRLWTGAMTGNQVTSQIAAPSQ